MCWFEIDDDSDIHDPTEAYISHEEVGDEDLSTAATLSWNYVQEDEDDDIDIEMPSRTSKLHRSFEAGRVKIKSLISCRDATGALWRRYRLISWLKTHSRRNVDIRRMTL